MNRNKIRIILFICFVLAFTALAGDGIAEWTAAPGISEKCIDLRISGVEKASTAEKAPEEEKDNPAREKNNFWEIRSDKSNPSQPEDNFWSVETAGFLKRTI